MDLDRAKSFETLGDREQTMADAADTLLDLVRRFHGDIGESERDRLLDMHARLAQPAAEFSNLIDEFLARINAAKTRASMRGTSAPCLVLLPPAAADGAPATASAPAQSGAAAPSSSDEEPGAP